MPLKGEGMVALQLASKLSLGGTTDLQHGTDAVSTLITQQLLNSEVKTI